MSPAWGSTTWRGDAERWGHAELARIGATPAGEMVDVSIQPWSAVWRIPTTRGAFLVKQPSRARAAEVGVHRFCARTAPTYVDAIIADDPTTPRLLVADGGPSMYEAEPVARGIEIDTMIAMITDYAHLQQDFIGRRRPAAASGLPVWDPADAAGIAERISGRLGRLPASDPRHLNAERAELVSASLDDLRVCGRAVAESPVPWCLEHGDVWPGNILPPGQSSRYRFFDFGDAAWSHPFVSLIMPIIECRFRWSVPDQPDRLNVDDARLREIVDVYLGCWTGYAPIAELRVTMQHALRLGPLRRCQAWLTNLDGAGDTDLERLGHLPATWLEDVTRPVVGL